MRWLRCCWDGSRLFFGEGIRILCLLCINCKGWTIVLNRCKNVDFSCDWRFNLSENFTILRRRSGYDYSLREQFRWIHTSRCFHSDIFMVSKWFNWVFVDFWGVRCPQPILYRCVNWLIVLRSKPYFCCFRCIGGRYRFFSCFWSHWDVGRLIFDCPSKVSLAL